MAEVLFLGGNKVRSINDIIGTSYIEELLVYFVEGKLEKWMNEEKSSNMKFLEHLASINKDFSIDTIDKIKNLFDIKEAVTVISNQSEFELAMSDNETVRYILLGGHYSLTKGSIKETQKILVSLSDEKASIDVGRAFETKFKLFVEYTNIEVNFVNLTPADLVEYIKTNNLQLDEKLELINSIEVSNLTQELIALKVDCLLQLGEINEAITVINQIADDGEKFFCLYDARKRISNDENSRKEIIDTYLKPAVSMGNVKAVAEYVLILKDGSKSDKKTAFETLDVHASKSAILLNLLGDFYLNGIGTKSDFQRAIEKYKAAMELLNSCEPEMNHAITGIGNCLMAQGKADEAMEYYSMSSDSEKVRQVVKYFKEKQDVPQVESHYIKCKNLGDIDAIYELSEYLYSQGEAYQTKSLDYAIEYVRMSDADVKKKKAILTKQILRYDKKEKHEKDKIVCNRIEKEAADNGLHITRTMCKVKNGAEQFGKWAGTTVGGAVVMTGVSILINKFTSGRNKQ